MVSAGDNTVVRHLRIQDLPTARDQTVMRQLRIRDLPAAAGKLVTGFVVVLIGAALFWAYQLHQVVTERDYLIRTIAFEASGETEIPLNVGDEPPPENTLGSMWANSFPKMRELRRQLEKAAAE